MKLHDDSWDAAGLHRTAPGVTEQLVDCSGGDVRNEDTGFARKAEALTRVMAAEVRNIASFPFMLPGSSPTAGMEQSTQPALVPLRRSFQAMSS